jgi:hypothetical protein
MMEIVAEKRDIPVFLSEFEQLFPAHEQTLCSLGCYGSFALSKIGQS